MRRGSAVAIWTLVLAMLSERENSGGGLKEHIAGVHARIDEVHADPGVLVELAARPIGAVLPAILGVMPT
jgi:hypothetical protein